LLSFILCTQVLSIKYVETHLAGLIVYVHLWFAKSMIRPLTTEATIKRHRISLLLPDVWGVSKPVTRAI